MKYNFSEEITYYNLNLWKNRDKLIPLPHWEQSQIMDYVQYLNPSDENLKEVCDLVIELYNIDVRFICMAYGYYKDYPIEWNDRYNKIYDRLKELSNCSEFIYWTKYPTIAIEEYNKEINKD